MTAWLIGWQAGPVLILALASSEEAATTGGWGKVATIWGIVAVLIAINGLFVAAEIALVGVRPTHLRHMSEGGSSSASALLHTLGSPERQRRYFASTQLGITTASIGLGMYGEHQLATLFAPVMERLGLPVATAHTIAVPLAIVLLTFLHVVIGEMVPKTLALRFPTAAVQRVAPVMIITQRLLRPLVALISWLSGLALRILPGHGDEPETRIFSARELGRTIAASAAQGLIARPDERILLDVIDFGEREVYHVMTARTRIAALPLSVDEDELQPYLAASPHTRIPIFEEDLDHIVGVLHVKDYLRAWNQVRAQRNSKFQLTSILREAHVVPEHLPLTQLLERFQRSREHLAIVIDEYGGTAGIVTLEDVIEELVGEVRDEFDIGEVPPVRQFRPGALLVRGDVQLDDLEDFLALESERPDVDTVGGLLVNLLGEPAEVGDRAMLGEVAIVAQQVDGYTVEMVLVSFPEHLARRTAPRGTPTS
jgi:CBS domain containing-hemolysin-like protein